MTTNADLAEFRARKRSGHHTFQFPPPRESPLHPSWMAPREDRALLHSIAVALVVVLLAGLAFGIYGIAADARHESWAKQLVAECVAQGQRPIVDRDVKDRVLAVRCEP